MDRYLEFNPVVCGSGFKMDGYYVWCGSAIYENGTYYLFASRWPKEKTFPIGYMTDSEIVLAKTDDLSKPFEYVKTIISKRDGGYWDSLMAHNPYIIKMGDKYVLYYIGTPDGEAETRKIGYAYSDSIDGEYIRSDKPIELPQNANNPSIARTQDGKILLYFRNGRMEVSVAVADKFDGEYTVAAENLFKKGGIEDMFVFYDGEKYVMITEDDGSIYTGNPKSGVMFTSADGIIWNDEDPLIAYDFDLVYDDGSTETLQRRERPMILFMGEKQYLFTSAKRNGETILTGGDTWNMLQEITKFNR